MKYLKIALVIVAVLIAVPVIGLQAIKEAKAKEAVLATATTPSARECLRLKQDRPSPWNVSEDKYREFLKGWVDTCTAAVASDPNDHRLKLALENALFTSDRRPEAIALLRKMAADNDAEALVEIYEWHKSWERHEIGAQHTVTRDEAADALRRAAELGNAFAMHRLAVLYDRGDIVKRDNSKAITWAERSLRTPDGEWGSADIATLLGRLRSQSNDPEQRALGLDLLKRLVKAGRPDAKAYLAIAIRKDDPSRARQLLEEAMRGAEGAALPDLADMLIKGEGGTADPKRAVKLLKASATPSKAAAISFALGALYRDGQLVPRDPQEAANLMRGETVWSVDATITLAQLLANNPTVTTDAPERFLYTLNEAADLGEPNAMMTLIALKLSSSAQFADKTGGCTLVQRAIANGDEGAKKFLAGCS